MKVLVVNAGSSSLKYQLLNMETEEIIAKGNCEKVCLDKSFIRHKANGVETIIETPIPNHEVAIKLVLDTLKDPKIGVIKDISEINAIGHRVVAGGEKYINSCLVDEKIALDLQNLTDFAPLHAIPNSSGILGCLKVAKNIPNVSVFDTAFHSTMPEYAYLYALPMSLYRDYKVRRYGFHGTSHKFVSQILLDKLDMPVKDSKVIVCHLGNGSSISAIKGGECVDTSMGMTPLEGIIMGTRSGDVDANILQFVCKKKGWDLARVTDMLNKESGLLGISELSSDMRDLCEAIANGNKQAELALEMLAYRIKKYIGSYSAVLNGVDAIAFTAGIGENTPELREMILTNMEYLGVKFDKQANYSLKRGEEGLISTKDSKVKVFVIPTNEELAIARETVEVVNKNKTSK